MYLLPVNRLCWPGILTQLRFLLHRIFFHLVNFKISSEQQIIEYFILLLVGFIVRTWFGGTDTSHNFSTNYKIKKHNYKHADLFKANSNKKYKRVLTDFRCKPSCQFVSPLFHPWLPISEKKSLVAHIFV